MAKTPDRVVNVPTAPKASVDVESFPAVEPVSRVAAQQNTSSVTVTQLSELDSYILERQKEQPRTLEEVADRVEVLEKNARQRHRLTLPEYFEAKSYDHKTELPFVFRWLFKEKRAIDRALNVIGWTLVNRTYFPDAPRYLFTANGGVEVGDSILAFMPAKRAVAIRQEPGQRSRNRVEAQTTQVESDYVLMSGNAKDSRIYQPQMGSEAAETADTSVAGELVEGRDFP